jgi:hypothetical protein
MKAKHKLFFVLPLLTFLFTQLGFTQSGYTFKVLGVSGSVKKLSSTGEVNLTTGSKLQPEESIVVENGYCGLIHSSGKGVEVKKSGTYLVSDLNKTITSGGKQAKVSDRYVNYVIGQLTKEESEDINSNHRKYMEVTGAVERTSTNYIINTYNEQLPDFGNISLKAKSDIGLHNFSTYEEVNKHFIVLYIYYKNLNCKLISQKPKTEMFNFISNIGGLLGVFLGISFLSFIEIFETFFEILIYSQKFFP